MSLRDWLLIGGSVLLLIVLLDGVRRMLRQRGRLRLDIDRNLSDIPEPDLSAELPNGGARPARVQPGNDSATIPTLSRNYSSSSKSDRSPLKVHAKQQPDDDEVDLLLADDLQGVGQGADRWLSTDATSLDAEMEPLHVDSAIDDGWVDRSWQSSEPFDDDAEEAVGRPRRVQVASKTREETGTKVEPESKVKLGTSSKDAIQPPAADGSGKNGSDDSADPSRLALAEKAPLEADGLDLNKPVPELVQQMATLQRTGSQPIPDARLQTGLADGPKAAAKGQPVAESHGDLEAGAVEPAPREDPLDAPEPPVMDSAPLTATRDEDTAPISPQPTTAKDASVAETAPKGRGRKGRKKKRRLSEIQINIFDAHPDLAPEPEPELKPAPKPRGAKPAPRPAAAPQSDPVDEVLVISVAARREPFAGDRLFKLLAACDLGLGDMAIFHRHEEPGGKGPVQFSMANAVKPGTFDLTDPDHFRTPAVTFFLNMAEPRDLANAFDCMLATAKCLADNLDGELKDENRSTLRPQTIEHCRQRIRDFKRRRMTRR